MHEFKTEAERDSIIDFKEIQQSISLLDEYEKSIADSKKNQKNMKK